MSAQNSSGLNANRPQTNGQESSRPKISPYIAKRSFAAEKIEMKMLKKKLDGRNIPAEVAAHVRDALESAGSPSNIAAQPMSIELRSEKFNKMKHRQESSLRKPGDDYRIDMLRKMYKAAKSKSTELSARYIEDGATRDSAIPLKSHGQQAARVYLAISTLLYASISLNKIDDLEKFVYKKSAALPGSIFDMSQWQTVLDVARDVRSKRLDGFANKTKKDTWQLRTPGPQDANRDFPDTVEIEGTDWEEDMIDLNKMHLGTSLEEEDFQAELSAPIKNNWMFSPPPSRGGSPQPPASSSNVNLSANSAVKNDERLQVNQSPIPNVEFLQREHDKVLESVRAESTLQIKQLQLELNNANAQLSIQKQAEAIQFQVTDNSNNKNELLKTLEQLRLAQEDLGTVKNQLQHTQSTLLQSQRDLHCSVEVQQKLSVDATQADKLAHSLREEVNVLRTKLANAALEVTKLTHQQASASSESDDVIAGLKIKLAVADTNVKAHLASIKSLEDMRQIAASQEVALRKRVAQLESRVIQIDSQKSREDTGRSDIGDATTNNEVSSASISPASHAVRDILHTASVNVIRSKSRPTSPSHALARSFVASVLVEATPASTKSNALEVANKVGQSSTSAESLQRALDDASARVVGLQYDNEYLQKRIEQMQQVADVSLESQASQARSLEEAIQEAARERKAKQALQSQLQVHMQEHDLLKSVHSDLLHRELQQKEALEGLQKQNALSDITQCASITPQVESEVKRLAAELAIAHAELARVTRNQMATKADNTTTFKKVDELSTESAYKVGVAVEANFNGSGQWFRGKIAKVTLSGDIRTYDIDYDDGDKESSKVQTDVRLWPSVSATIDENATQQLEALRKENKELLSKVSLLEMTVRAKTQDLDTLNKEFVSEVKDIENKQRALEKRAATAESTAKTAQMELNALQVAMAALKTEYDSCKELLDSTKKPADVSNGLVASTPYTPEGSVDSIGSGPSPDAKPKSGGTIVRYEARIASMEASSTMKANAFKEQINEKNVTIDALKAVVADLQSKDCAAQAVFIERDRLLADKTAQAELHMQEISSIELELMKQKKMTSDLQLKLNETSQATATADAGLVASSTVSAEGTSHKHSITPNITLGSSNIKKELPASSHLWGIDMKNASPAQRKAGLCATRIARGYLGRLKAQQCILERSAKINGILAAFRPAGTIQGKAGWYTSKDALFYFALEEGEFVLVAGPLTNDDFYDIRADMQKLNIDAHHVGDIEIDRSGIHAARWQCSSLKAQLEAANRALGPEGDMNKLIVSLKKDVADKNAFIKQLKHENASLGSSLNACKSHMENAQKDLEVEKTAGMKLQRDIKGLNELLRVERSAAKMCQDPSSPGALSSSSVIIRARQLSSDDINALIQLQAYIRRFLVQRRIFKMRLQDLATISSTLIAMPGTSQGRGGWYLSPDRSIYYFVQRHNDWIIAAGPLDEKQYNEPLLTSVQVKHHKSYNAKTNLKQRGGRRVNQSSHPNSLTIMNKKPFSTASDVLIKCKYELAIERADLDGDVFMDKKTKALYLAVSVERLIKHSNLHSNRDANNAFLKR